MKKEKSVWAIVIIAFWCASPNHARAQQDSLAAHQLEDVVVTATKFPKNLSETGKVLLIIDEEQLRRGAGKDIAQLLNEQAGVVINGANSNPGKDKAVYLRGASTQYTLILIDGVPVTDPSGIGGAFDLRLLPLDQIERIEVLKGSQSTLYGTDAVAGVINLITKKKQDQHLSGAAGMAGGSYGSMKGNVSIAGNAGKWDYRFGYSGFRSNGISEAKDPGNTGTFDNDGFTQHAFQASAGLQATRAFVLRPSFRYNTFDGRYDEGPFTDSKINSFQTRLINAGLSSQYDYKSGSWNLLYGYDQNDRTFTSTPTYVGRFHHAETFMQHNFTEYLQLLGGASYQHIYMQDDAASVKNPNVTIFSPYLSLFLRNLKGISAELGGRLNQHSAYGTNLTWSFNPSWQASRSLKVFFNAGSGFKAPTLNQLYGQYGPNPDLRPEVSQSLEAGAQFALPHKGTDIRFAIFQRDIRDVIFFSYDPVTSNALYVNLNRQHDVGLEVETSGKLNPWITWRASYAYVDGQITDRSGSKDSTYHNLYRRPKHTVGLYLGYQMTKTFFVSGNLKTFSKRSDLYFNLSNFKTENVTLDAYALLDVYIEYKPGKERWKLFFDAKNVLNQDYMEVYGYNAMRFNWMAGINVGF